jgi:hypothetical protein
MLKVLHDFAFLLAANTIYVTVLLNIDFAAFMYILLGKMIW